ncbi:MAG: RluA family pseudouridine synthase [Armatimonadota bacterium]|nr:RluA family pseudouridine synthase [Armatimonadota bacterium]
MPEGSTDETHTFVVDAAAAGRRLDAYLAAQAPGLSRARIQALIEAGCVSLPRLAGQRVRPAVRLRAGDVVVLAVPPPAPTALQPEPLPLDIVYEDTDLLVINKPPGLAVHPGAGRAAGTLVHAVLAHCPDLPGVGGTHRPGIVHRLDKDTSGVLVVAKTETALRHLHAEIAARRASRDYLALVWGVPDRAAGTIAAPIGRDPRQRTRMAVRPDGRPAATQYRVIEAFPAVALLEVRLLTGRTHQIRVHCAHIGHPVVGDPVYGRRRNPWGLTRQALHAYRLAFTHPRDGRAMHFEVPLPDDLAAVLRALRAGSGRSPEAAPSAGHTL